MIKEAKFSELPGEYWDVVGRLSCKIRGEDPEVGSDDRPNWVREREELIVLGSQLQALGFVPQETGQEFLDKIKRFEREEDDKKNPRGGGRQGRSR